VSRVSRVSLGALLAIAVLLVLFGIGDIQAGPTADPAITMAIAAVPNEQVAAADALGYRLYDFAIRMGGLNLAFIGLLLGAILVGPYRAGVRWAWSTMWLLPGWAVAVPLLILAFGPAPGVALPPPAISGPIVALVAAGALLADRSRFVENEIARRWLAGPSASGRSASRTAEG
jgi:hypothetical protein